MTATVDTHPSENVLQTLFRVFGSLIGIIGVFVMAAAIVGFAIAIVWSVVVMIMGVSQSIQAKSKGEKPQISDFTFHLCLYLFAIPIFMQMVMTDEYCGEYGAATVNTYKILLMYSAYLVLRYKILPLVMRRSTAAVHANTGAILAILLYPCYAVPLYYLGLVDMIGACGRGMIYLLQASV